MAHHVYHLACASTQELLYVGRGLDPKKRKTAFMRRYGRPVDLVFVRKFPSLESAQRAELEAIQRLKPPFNKNLVSSPGTVGMTFTDQHKLRLRQAHIGKIMSPEARAKMSAAKMGTTPWCTGKRLTLEHRQKLSDSHKGIFPSAETRAKLSAARTGRTISAETRAKIGAANKKRAAERKARRES